MQAHEAETEPVGPADSHALAAANRLATVRALPRWWLKAKVERCLLVGAGWLEA